MRDIPEVYGKWWSASHRCWKYLDAMHDKELLNSWRKFDRGDYRYIDGAEVKPTDGTDYANALTAAFAAEFLKRGMDPTRPDGRMVPPAVDERGME